MSGRGNGPINAFVNALEGIGLKDFKLIDYRQHSIGGGSATESAAFVQLQTKVGRVAYGCVIDSSIEKSGLLALVPTTERGNLVRKHPEFLRQQPRRGSRTHHFLQRGERLPHW